MVYPILILAFFLILDSTGVLKLGTVFKALLQAAAIILVLYVIGLGSFVWLLKKSASMEEDFSKERSNQVFNRSNNKTLPDLDKYQVEDKVAKTNPAEMAIENKHNEIEFMEPSSEDTETSIYTGTPDENREAYYREIWEAIAKYRKYPRIAHMRNWQGEAIVELELDSNGKFKSKKIIQSSGHEVLDKQALEMVEKALPFPPPPKNLFEGKESFFITIPIPFTIK